MSADELFTLTLTVKAGGEQVVTDYCVAHLRERGYSVTAPGEKWETAAQFNKRLGICWQGIHRALKRPGCPNVLIKYGPGRGPGGKRIAGICSNPAFDAFVTRHKTGNQHS
jgi:hypothetical protein